MPVLEDRKACQLLTAVWGFFLQKALQELFVQQNLVFSNSCQTSQLNCANISFFSNPLKPALSDFEIRRKIHLSAISFSINFNSLLWLTSLKKFSLCRLPKHDGDYKLALPLLPHILLLSYGNETHRKNHNTFAHILSPLTTRVPFARLYPLHWVSQGIASFASESGFWDSISISLKRSCF